MARRFAPYGLILLASSLLCVLNAQAQTQRHIPSFGSSVEMVNLNVSVQDGDHRFVQHLSERDFSIYEDGVTQRLALFTEKRLPISLAVLIDSSSSMGARLQVAQTAALRLLRTLQQEDEATVVQFNERYGTLQGYTPNFLLLENAINRLKAEGTTALYSALYVALKELGARGREADFRRKALVVLSDGEDTSSPIPDERVLEQARKGAAIVYSVGLFSPTKVLSDGPSPSFFLQRMARDTGGRTFFPQAVSDLDDVYDHIADELRNQYVIGYVSSNPRMDGRWRNVVISAGSGRWTVHHRAGYYPKVASGRSSSSEIGTSE